MILIHYIELHQSDVIFSYDSLGPDARSVVIKDCEMRLVVAFDEVNVRNILDSSQPCLKVIVTVRDVKPRLVEVRSF